MLSYGEKRALSEIQSVIDSQWSNGMLPQIRFVTGQRGYSPDEKEWGVTRDVSGCQDQDTSGITQPPILGYALQKIVGNAEHEEEMLVAVEEFYQSVKRYHDFLLRERDPNGENLVVIIHPWETGTDNSPYLDEPIFRTRTFLREKGYEQRIKQRRDVDKVSHNQRPGSRDYDCFGRLIDFFIKYDYDQQAIIEESEFVIQDLLFNVIFAVSVRGLSILTEKLAKCPSIIANGKHNYYKEQSTENSRSYDKIVNAIQSRLYAPREDMFYSYDVKEGSLLKSDTIHCLCPVFGHCATENQANRICARISDEEEFFTDVRIPSVSVRMKEFDELKYWRGPVWPVTNWIVCEGLAEYGLDKAKEIAREITKSTIRMIELNKDVPEPEGLELAASLMEFNSYNGTFTTPSRSQYYHGWFWDSCLAAIGWVHVPEKLPRARVEKWEKIIKERLDTFNHKRGLDTAYEYRPISTELEHILFDEYYVPRDCLSRGYRAGMPIGAPMMTWSASLYLDMRKSIMAS